MNKIEKSPFYRFIGLKQPLGLSFVAQCFRYIGESSKGTFIEGHYKKIHDKGVTNERCLKIFSLHSPRNHKPPEFQVESRQWTFPNIFSITAATKEQVSKDLWMKYNTQRAAPESRNEKTNSLNLYFYYKTQIITFHPYVVCESLPYWAAAQLEQLSRCDRNKTWDKALTGKTETVQKKMILYFPEFMFTQQLSLRGN